MYKIVTLVKTFKYDIYTQKKCLQMKTDNEKKIAATCIRAYSATGLYHLDCCSPGSISLAETEDAHAYITAIIHQTRALMHPYK